MWDINLGDFTQAVKGLLGASTATAQFLFATSLVDSSDGESSARSRGASRGRELAGKSHSMEAVPRKGKIERASHPAFKTRYLPLTVEYSVAQRIGLLSRPMHEASPMCMSSS